MGPVMNLQRREVISSLAAATLVILPGVGANAEVNSGESFTVAFNVTQGPLGIKIQVSHPC